MVIGTGKFAVRRDTGGLVEGEYKQPTKTAAREAALQHAVELLTSRRDEAAIVPSDHVDQVRAELQTSNIPGYHEISTRCRQEDVRSWRSFRATQIGRRDAAELTIAYLAGPEPTNDLAVLVGCGVRPENIWAFEAEPGVFERGVLDLKASHLRGVKIVPSRIDEYFAGTPQRFDIVYLDACGPLPSHEQKTGRLLTNVFRHSALAPLGVLITNFSKPDISKAEVLENFSFLIAAYLFPKSFLDDEEGGFTDGASEHGYRLRTDDKPAESFYREVIEKFDHYYGSFITRHILDIASITAPSIRLTSSGMYKILFAPSIEDAAKRASKYVRFADGAFGTGDSADTEDDEIDGDALMGDAPEYSLLWTLAACGLLNADKDNFDPPPASSNKFLDRWANQLHPDGSKKAIELISAYYAWRHDVTFHSPAMKVLSDFPYQKKMPMLCDAPTRELAFYPAFAQLAYPAHANIREAKRFQYVAEGKSTTMFLDVLPFDECRYVYDWLSALHLVPTDWGNLSAQLTFRFALDGIAKMRRWYGDDFLNYCHVVDIFQGGISAAELGARKRISPA